MCGALVGGASPGTAQQYPVRPIRVVIPQAPGATTDILGRIVLTRMSERLEKQIVVDNRPGAGGTLGMEIVARAVPDGYTLAGVAASMLTIAPHTYQKIAYDPLRDFLPVGMFECIRVDHLEEDPLVARQPLAEDALPLAVAHGPISLAPSRSKAGA